MNREDVIKMALKSRMYQDGEMFYSFITVDADVHISDLEYFAKRVAAAEREACAKLCEELRDEDGYEAWGKECAAAIRARDMSTKSQNVNTSAERVHAIDKSIQEIKRLTDLNQRLVEVAKELGYADDTHEWDDAWSKMCKLFKEC